jgi:hypothetical protein
VQLPRTDAGATLAAMAPPAGTSAYSKRPAPRAAKTELNADLPKQQQANAKAAAIEAWPHTPAPSRSTASCFVREPTGSHPG